MKAALRPTEIKVAEEISDSLIEELNAFLSKPWTLNEITTGRIWFRALSSGERSIIYNHYLCAGWHVASCLDTRDNSYTLTFIPGTKP